MLEILKEQVFKANLDLVKNGLVQYTWGNVSGIDQGKKLVVIKPSGVPYENMKAADMVIVDLDGNVVEGDFRPSSDTSTHLEIYKAFPEIGGIVHTHSTYATAFSQAKTSIPAIGTTHADYFYGDVPCTRELKKAEIEQNYEANTGKIIAATLSGDVLSVPGILVGSHGPFAWGTDADKAVFNATVLEQIAKLAFLTLSIEPQTERVQQYLLDKHYTRKHGSYAYYGQESNDAIRGE